MDTYSSEDVDLAIDSRSGMPHSSLGNIACALGLVVLASLDVDAVHSIRDWFSRLDLASCISGVDGSKDCDSPSEYVDFLIDDGNTMRRFE